MRRHVLVVALGLAMLGACSATPDEAPSTAPETTAAGGSVTIFAAASLQGAFTEIISQFEEANPGVTVETPVFDGSPTLLAQIEEGASASVFATADTATMDEFVGTGLAGSDPQIFATNTLQIAVPTGNPLGITDLTDLEGIDYVVCAAEVPCGRATEQLFELDGVPLTPLSMEQSVSAVADRVSSGEVDAGMVYATDVASRTDTLTGVTPTGADQVVNEYPIVLVDGSDANSQLYIDFVLSDAGQAVLAEAGFGSP